MNIIDNSYIANYQYTCTYEVKESGSQLYLKLNKTDFFPDGSPKTEGGINQLTSSSEIGDFIGFNLSGFPGLKFYVDTVCGQLTNSKFFEWNVPVGQGKINSLYLDIENIPQNFLQDIKDGLVKNNRIILNTKYYHPQTMLMGED